MKTLSAVLAAGLAGLAASGCVLHSGGAAPVAVTGDREFDTLWTAAVDVLHEHGFSVDRSDRRAGVITTFPLTGRHWFEFWRRDAVTARDTLEGTLQTIYRQATVTIRRPAPAAAGPASAPAPPAGEGKFDLAVTVQTSRSDRPAAQVTNTSEAYRMFLNPRSEEGTRGRVKRPEDVRVPVGRDEGLEKVLRRRIMERARAGEGSRQ